MRQRPEINRAFPILDIEIERAGDGRTVIAYAATFVGYWIGAAREGEGHRRDAHSSYHYDSAQWVHRAL